VKKVIPLWKEVEYFKEYQRRLRRYVGRARAKRIVSDALYVVSIGTNDLLENYFLFVTGRFAEFTVPEFEDFLVAQAEWFLTEIHRLGARRATFAGLTPIGCLPLERTLNMLRGGCIEEYNQVARDYNAKLQDMLRRLQATHPGFKVAYVNVYQTMLDLINNPGTLGEFRFVITEFFLHMLQMLIIFYCIKPFLHLTRAGERRGRVLCDRKV
jgi:hypothetical protein